MFQFLFGERENVRECQKETQKGRECLKYDLLPFSSCVQCESILHRVVQRTSIFNELGSELREAWLWDNWFHILVDYGPSLQSRGAEKQASAACMAASRDRDSLLIINKIII